MKSIARIIAVGTTIVIVSGCGREERGPLLAGGREVKWWVTALRDPKPQARRQAVLKLGNVGDADPSVAEALAGALLDTDTRVRKYAVFAVLKLKQPSEAIVTQLDTMSRSDLDAEVRNVAKQAHTRLTGPK